jgi:predicted DNA-binding antitoxin AbrB/MazE fold protein
MVRVVTAIYDGQVLRPEQPLGVRANTRVRITVETDEQSPEASASFLETAQALNLEGPADWSENFEDYLYKHGQNA